MKKYTVILAAFAMFAFAACNKDSEKGYTMNDNGTVNITIGCNAPTDNPKQSFNGERMRIYFTAGDQIMVNDGVYNVSPKPTTVAGTSSNMSNRGSVTVPTSSNYRFYFTAQTYTVRTDGSYEVNMLSEVNLLGNGVSNPFDENNQAWPMYAECADLTTLSESGVELLNAVGVISPVIIYGPEWCDAAFATLAGVPSFNANECPDLRVNHVVIRSNQKLTGTATLNTDDYDDPEIGPFIEMDGGQWMPAGQLDEVICHVTNPQNMIPTAGQQAVLNIVGNLPIAPYVYRPTYQMDIYFEVDINGTTYYYMFETITKRHTDATPRHMRDWLTVNFQTVGSLPAPQADDPAGSIRFSNGLLSAPSTTDLWNPAK